MKALNMEKYHWKLTTTCEFYCYIMMDRVELKLANVAQYHEVAIVYVQSACIISSLYPRLQLMAHRQ